MLFIYLVNEYEYWVFFYELVIVLDSRVFIVGKRKIDYFIVLLIKLFILGWYIDFNFYVNFD